MPNEAEDDERKMLSFSEVKRTASANERGRFPFGKQRAVFPPQESLPMRFFV